MKYFDDKEDFEDIYASLKGMLIPEYTIPWVENAYVRGGVCERKYIEMRDAYERLCDRLGVDVDDEDEDLNDIVNSLEVIQRQMCECLYRSTLKRLKNSPNE